MLGDRDTFEFQLALDLGKTLDEIRAMPQADYVAFAAYYRVRAAYQDLYERSARNRRGG